MFSIQHLAIHYGNHMILKDCSFDLPDTGLIGILGPSGCGKTSLLYALSGLLKPSEGQILYNGRPLDRHHLRNQIAFMKQNDDLLPSLNVRDNITIGCQIAQTSYTKREFNHLIRHLQIDHLLHRYPHELSIGQQKRVSLARALLKKAAVILCDEPTGALHSKMAQTIMSLLEEASKKALVIVVSHDEKLLLESTSEIIRFDHHLLKTSLSKSHQTVDKLEIKHKRQSLLPVAVKEVMYYRRHYFILCMFQWLVLSGFLLLLSGVNGLKTSIDEAKTSTVLKNIITVEDPNGQELTLNDARARRHFLFDYGTIKEKAAKGASVACLPADCDHILLESGRLPVAADEVLISSALNEKLKNKTLHYTLDETMTLTVTGVLKDDFYHRKEIFMTSAFTNRYPDYQSRYIYDYESTDVEKDLKRLGKKYDVMCEARMTQMSYQTLITIGEMVAVVFLSVSLISSMMLMRIVFASISNQRRLPHALMRSLGLSKGNLRRQLFNESVVLTVALGTGVIIITICCIELINKVSPWSSIYHFTFIPYTFFMPYDMFVMVVIGLFLIVMIVNQGQLKGLDDYHVMMILRGED
ncbi:MAG: ATP-binding cassette domain-containing protein [Erysipelotrichaceae bacterium]|nr:ATP-binding cassette domain-containing protein [Erysipelotrichaceae bacterium]